jgi:hypothetical protein
MFLGQLKNLHKSTSGDFAKELQAGLKEPGYDFAAVVKNATDKARNKFLSGAKGERVDTAVSTGKSLTSVIDQRSKSMGRTGITRPSWRCWTRDCGRLPTSAGRTRRRRWSTRSRWVGEYCSQLAGMLTMAQRTVKRQLLEPVEIALSKPTPGMWDTVLSTYAKVSSHGEESYLAKAKSE